LHILHQNSKLIVFSLPGYDPGKEKTISFEFWCKMCNCPVSRQQS
jgi:hypothetical protein